MPNSDGSTTINCIPSTDPLETNGSVVLQNGIHEEDKDDCHVNGETSPLAAANGIDKDVYTASEISAASPLTMKIMRKRTSDTEIVHESSKKSKLSDNICEEVTKAAQTEPVIESPKEGEGTGEEVEKKIESEITVEKANGNGNVNEENKESTPPDCDTSSSSSIIFVETDDKSSQPVKIDEEVKTAESGSNDAKVKDVEMKEGDAEEKSPKETTSQDDSIPIKSEDNDTSVPLRESVLDAYNRHLKKAVTCSIASLHRITQSLSTHNNNWQTKYHHLHNRFLHLKVCTDKLVENATKDPEKQSRSIEAQTEDDSTTPATVNSTASGTPNPPPRQSPAAGNGAKISGPAPTAQNDTQPQVQSSTQATQSQTQQSCSGSTLLIQPQHPQQPQPQVSQQQHQQQQQQQQAQQSQQQSQLSHPQLQAQPQQLVIVSPNGGQAALPRARVLIAAPSGVIDLTEDDVSANVAHSLRTPGISISPPRLGGREAVIGDQRIRHPMPLPRMTSPVPNVPCKGLPPPSPYLTVSPTEDGVCLKWNIPNLLPNVYSKLKRYRLFNYSKTPQSVFFSFQNPWKEIGSVDSMDLPMACTLTQIQSNSVYYFAIRPVDEYERLGIWSNTATIELAAVDS